MDLSSDLSKDLKAKGNQRYFMQVGSFGAKSLCLCQGLRALHSYQLKRGLWVLLPPQIEA